jgi:hypothetical protein
MASLSAVEWTATGLDAHLAAGAEDAERDLAPLGDQDLVEHFCASRHYFDDLSASPNSTRSAFTIRMRATVACLWCLDRD